MKIAIILLDQVLNVNNFKEVTELDLTDGNATPVYIRLVSDDGSDSDCKTRYIPATGATLTLKFDNLDSNKVITKVATNPFPDDRSIWKFDVLANDKIAFNSMSATLVEGSNSTKLESLSILSSSPTGSKRFYC